MMNEGELSNNMRFPESPTLRTNSSALGSRKLNIPLCDFGQVILLQLKLSYLQNLDQSFYPYCLGASAY